MSHLPNPNVDNSGFNYPSAAGVRTNIDQTHFGQSPVSSSSAVESSSSVPMKTTVAGLHSPYGGALDPNHGQLGGEHGGAGTRNDDRKGEVVLDEANSASPVAGPIEK